MKDIEVSSVAVRVRVSRLKDSIFGSRLNLGTSTSVGSAKTDHTRRRAFQVLISLAIVNKTIPPIALPTCHYGAIRGTDHRWNS